MLDERFDNIARKPLAPNIKEEKWQALSVAIAKEKKKHRLSYYSVLIAFSCFLFFLIQTFQTPTQIERQTASVSELGTITEAIFLKNERPTKRLNLTSPLYIERVVITEKDELQKLQQLFAHSTLEPIERELSTYEYSQDLLLQFANGESRYIKITSGPFNSPSVIIDMELQQRYVAEINDLSSEVEKVRYDNANLSLSFIIKLLISFFIIAITFLFVQRRKRKLETPIIKRKRVAIIGGVISILLFLTILSGQDIFGASHLGLMALCAVGQQVLPAYIYQKWGNVKADWFGISLLLAAIFIALAIMLI